MIEEDPDTMLDVLHLLDHGSLPRARSRQMITRTGTDRLQLSGAVVLTDGHYALLNRAYRQALAGHFTHGARRPRPAHRRPLERGDRVPGARGWQADGAGAGRTSGGRAAIAARSTQHAARTGARPQLLEAIVQSIYAADSLEQSCELLASGLRLGFGLTDVSIYRAVPAQGRLERVYPPAADGSRPPSVDLHDPACVEAQTFIYGNYALRGTADEARLVVDAGHARAGPSAS